MSEYRKQAAFLKALLAYDDNNGHRLLCERLAHAERNERCLLCACRLVGLIALLALAGIGYSAVLLPQFFDNSTHVILRFFTALGLGSSLCFTFFLGLWFWYRSTTNRIHEECRQAINSMLQSRLKTTTPPAFHPVLVPDADARVVLPKNVHPSPSEQLASLPKAS